MHDEGLIDSQVALARTDKFSLADLEVAQLAGEHGEAPEPVAQASSAAFGVAAGKIAFDEEAAHRYASEGHAVILVRRDAETRDIAALELASGLLTRNGSRTSHAAVVARQLGKVCLVGCASLEIDLQARQAVFQGMRLAEGALVTIDGNGGGVYVGRLALVRRAPKGLWERLESFRQSACCLRTTDAVTI
jgi:pyruvate,orthophosphate dikinase